jgi:hypothetical protein
VVKMEQKLEQVEIRQGDGGFGFDHIVNNDT